MHIRSLGGDEQVLVFVDTQKFDSQKLSERIAQLGAKAMIVDSGLSFKAFSNASEKCLDSEQIATSLDILIKNTPTNKDQHLVLCGIGDGALIPFLNAETKSGQNVTNLSIDFSAVLTHLLCVVPTFHSQ